MATQAMLVILAVFLSLASAQVAVSGYIGCFPNPTFAGMQFGPGYKSTSQTVREDCQAFCYGKTMEYAYLRNGECLCDPYGDFTNGGAVSDSVCNNQAYDGPAGSTDGSHVSAYATGFDYTFRLLNECWSSSTSLYTATLADNQPATCISHCSSLGYSAAGVSNGTQCHCLDYNSVVTGGAHIVSESNCNIPCPGLWSATCGGTTGIDIYATETIYAGCYEDTATRVLPKQSITGVLTTPELCQTICYNLGWSIAGLQDGDQCFCGTTPGTKAPESDCNMPCAGDSTLTCGGAWRNSVYVALQVWEASSAPSGWYQSSSSAFGVSDYGTVFGK